MKTRAWVESLYGEEFAIRGTELKMPWGTVYIMLEVVLKYSPTSYRLAGQDGKTFWCAIDDTSDRARVKIYKDIKARLDEHEL